MEAPPINLFSNRVDPDAIKQLVLAAHPEAEVEKSPDGGWSSIRIQRKQRGMFKKPQTLEINHSSDYYAGPGWSKQLTGMTEYFLKFPVPDDLKAPLTAVIEEFGFAVSFVSSPPVSPGDDDFRYDLMLEIGKKLDACFFIPGHLLDSEGRVLVSADGETDPDATLPKLTGSRVTETIQGSLQRSDTGTAEDHEQDELDPPSPERVAARALVLAAVSARGLIELNASENEADHGELQSAIERALAWCVELGIEDEIEPGDREVLECPLGQLDERQHLDSIWRFEGLAVLAWALGLHDLPSYDEVAKADDLLPALGFLDLEKAAAILQAPNLRTAEELDQYGKQILACHWRLREFGLRAQAMDFRGFGETCWFGPLDMSWAKFEGDDLALDGTAIHEAGAEILATCSSIASERHLAINWLNGWSRVYSETDTST